MAQSLFKIILNILLFSSIASAQVGGLAFGFGSNSEVTLSWPLPAIERFGLGILTNTVIIPEDATLFVEIIDESYSTSKNVMIYAYLDESSNIMIWHRVYSEINTATSFEVQAGQTLAFQILFGWYTGWYVKFNLRLNSPTGELANSNLIHIYSVEGLY